MRRIISLILIVAFSISIIACSRGEKFDAVTSDQVMSVLTEIYPDSSIYCGDGVINFDTGNNGFSLQYRTTSENYSYGNRRDDYKKLKGDGEGKIYITGSYCYFFIYGDGITTCQYEAGNMFLKIDYYSDRGEDEVKSLLQSLNLPFESN